MTLKIDKFGRVLIPKALRQHLRVEPGDEINVIIHTEKPSIEISASEDTETSEITYTEWGLPIINPAGEFPEEFNFSRATQDGYDEYFKRILGF